MSECTPENFQKFATYWQDRLGLQNWDIVYEIIRAREFSEPYGAYGENMFNYESRSSVIKLMDPVDYHDPHFRYDMQHVLLHELLHAVLTPVAMYFPNDQEHLHVHLEQIINQLATAFCRVASDRDRILSHTDAQSPQ